MPAHCWSCIDAGNCCPWSGCYWASYNCSIDNTRDHPPLPLPDYIYRGNIWFCPNYNPEPYATTQHWSQFCNPATTEFQISK